MSRIAKNPVNIPSGVEVAISGGVINVKGSKGQLQRELHQDIEIKQEDNMLTFAAANGSIFSNAMAGTTRALINNMVVGVTDGFEKKLSLVGVGYRAQAKDKVLNLVLGFSHPVDYGIPAGISIETPSPTEIIIKGIDKQVVGQVAAEIRAYRPPEPYKGKGVRYVNETIVLKDAKKK